MCMECPKGHKKSRTRRPFVGHWVRHHKRCLVSVMRGTNIFFLAAYFLHLLISCICLAGKYVSATLCGPQYTAPMQLLSRTCPQNWHCIVLITSGCLILIFLPLYSQFLDVTFKPRSHRQPYQLGSLRRRKAPADELSRPNELVAILVIYRHGIASFCPNGNRKTAQDFLNFLF